MTHNIRYCMWNTYYSEQDGLKMLENAKKVVKRVPFCSFLSSDTLLCRAAVLSKASGCFLRDLSYKRPQSLVVNKCATCYNIL